MKDLPDWFTTGAGIYLAPDWAAKIGGDKDLTGSVASAVSGVEYTVITYVVPSGQALFIYHFGATTYPVAGNVWAYVADATLLVVKAITGGAQGCMGVLNKPIYIPGGHTLWLRAGQISGSTQTIVGHIGSILG